jgi:RsiW-degrading membrane proteinase PrsW (M82 family)
MKHASTSSNHPHPNPLPSGRGGSGGIGALICIASLTAALILFHAQTPWRILLPALVPAVIQGLVVAWIGRYLGARFLALSFLCGAVIAALTATLANQTLVGWLSIFFGYVRARDLTAIVAAPVVEELAKGGVVAVLLLIVRPRIDAVRDAILSGALVGIGFALTENIDYLFLTAVVGGEQHLPLMIYQRLLGSLNHPIFTATFAAGIGVAMARGPGRASAWAAAVAGSAAIAQHVAWNGITSSLSKSWLCAAPMPSDPCAAPSATTLFLWVPLVIAVSLAPGAIGLAVVIRRRFASVPSVLAADRLRW